MPHSSNDIQILRVGRERINDLEPLWQALHTHHAVVAPQFGETRSLSESWLRRKAEYEAWLNEPDTFILLAEKENQAIGYAFIRFKGNTSATWRGVERLAEIETLSILPEFRGMGLGSKLMEAIYTELEKEGVQDVSLVVVATNTAAIEFYERQGFTQRFVYLGRSLSDD